MTQNSADNTRPFLFLMAILLGLSVDAGAQYVSGQVYYGRNNYIEYYCGNAPLIISAPHAGTIAAAEIVDRTCGSTENDMNTFEMVMAIRDSFFVKTGKYPHVIVNRLSRIKLDANREINEATCGDAISAISYYEYHRFIDSAKARVIREYGKGLHNDLHGHGHTIQRVEIGYLLSSTNLALPDSVIDSVASVNASSFKHLAGIVPMKFSALIRGLRSLGNFLEEQGYPAVPSMTQPNPGTAPYYDGGYTVATHGSLNGGTIDAVLFELNRTGIRDTDANRRAFARAYVKVIDRFIQVHYFGATDTTVYADTVVTVQSGPWSSPDTWNGGVVPSSTRNVVIGTGDTVNVDVNTAQCKNLSFEAANAKLVLAADAVLSVYGNFTLYSTTHVPFLSWTPGAKLRFAGDALTQTLGGWNTSSSFAALMEVQIDKIAGKVVTSGLDMKLILGTSLEVLNGTFEIAAKDDIYGRDLAGTATMPMITVQPNGTFNIITGATQINSGTGSSGGPIGKLTVFGRATVTSTSTVKMQFGGIDIENGGVLTFGSGFSINRLKSGVLRIKNGGTLSNSLTTAVWDSTMSLVIDAGGTFTSSSSTTPFPPVIPTINNGTIRYSRTSAGDQIIKDMDYTNLQISNSGNTKVWTPSANRTVSGNLILDDASLLKIDSTGSSLNSRTISINGGIQLTSGNITTGDSATLVLGPSATCTGEATDNSVTGTIATTRSVGTAANGLGGIGVLLQAGSDDIGDVTVTRVSGPNGIVTVNGKQGIARTWKISSANPPSSGRTMTLSWISNDDNGKNLAAAQVWTSTDAGANWYKAGAAANASSSRSMSIQVNAFGRFTVSDENNAISDVEDAADLAPKVFSLGPNYPNPFNPTTHLRFTVPVSGRTRVNVYNSLGTLVRSLWDATAEPGQYYDVVFDAHGMSSGTYFVRMEQNGARAVRKILLVK